MADKSETLYEILGVSEDASPEEIRDAYRRSAKRHHPDHGGDPERFVEIANAYAVLSDLNHRASYDKTGKIDEKNVLADKDKVRRIMAMWLGQIIDLAIEKGAPVSSIDVIGQMREACRRSIDGIDGKMVKIGLQLSAYKDMRARIKREGDKRNEFVDIIDEKTEGLRTEYTEMRREHRLATLAMDELMMYDSSVSLFRSMMAYRSPGRSVFSSFFNASVETSCEAGRSNPSS